MPSGTDKNRSPPGQAAEQTGDDVGATKPASPANQATPQSTALLSMLRPPQADGELGRLAGFSILTLLGQGGMGAVFVAHDPLVRRRVALKVMRPELTARPESYQRFLREARSVGAVEHDHIIPVHQVGEDNGVLFIVMPLLHGEALDRRLAREHRLPIPAILKLGRETAEGLAAAHAHDLIHRDIKPGNLWLEGTCEDGVGFRRVKILDFGLARAVHDDSRLTAAGGVLGTPAYMAPEQADGQAVDHRADLFSLGAVLYRCCTGTPPFAGPSTLAILSALANKTPVPVREKNPDVPPVLADLIMRLLAKAPGERPQTAAEVAETLRRIEQDYTAPLAVRRPRSRLAIVCIAAVLALALATAAGVIVVKVRGPDGKESEVTAPEGSKIAVDPKGNVTVTLPPNAPKPAPTPPAKQADPAWLARVAKLPADEQVKEVTAELVRRNPGFSDSLQIFKDGDGRVSKVEVITNGIEDLSPFRGFPALSELMVRPRDGTGKVGDLSGLVGMRLTHLDVASNRVLDISPLRDMPLTNLVLDGNPLNDLSPLQKIRLRKIAFCYTHVEDISPLMGMPLEFA